MTMTVNTMHKLLGELIDRGHGRNPVCIDKSTFHHPLENDGTVILGVAGVYGPTFIINADDNGGTKFNKDGTESGRQTVVLVGEV